MKHDEKLKIIEEITKNTELNVDISKAVEKGMALRLRRQTIRFGILAAVLSACAGFLALKYSLEAVFYGAALALVMLVPVSVYMCFKKLKGGNSHAD